MPVACTFLSENAANEVYPYSMPPASRRYRYDESTCPTAWDFVQSWIRWATFCEKYTEEDCCRAQEIVGDGGEPEPKIAPLRSSSRRSLHMHNFSRTACTAFGLLEVASHAIPSHEAARAYLADVIALHKASGRQAAQGRGHAGSRNEYTPIEVRRTPEIDLAGSPWLRATGRFFPGKRLTRSHEEKSHEQRSDVDDRFLCLPGGLFAGRGSRDSGPGERPPGAELRADHRDPGSDPKQADRRGVSGQRRQVCRGGGRVPA